MEAEGKRQFMDKLEKLRERVTMEATLTGTICLPGNRSTDKLKLPQWGAEPLITHRVLEQHGIYKRFWNVTLENIMKAGVPTELQDQWLRVQQYAQYLPRHLDEGTGLILSGPVGTMKTTMAIAILRLLIDHRNTGYFIPMVSLLGLINDARMKHDDSLLRLENRIKKTPLLVLDDLGAEYDHVWVQAKVDEIITERYNRQKVTIVTTNLMPDKIIDRYQHRVYDRLRACNPVITFRVKSLRPKITFADL